MVNKAPETGYHQNNRAGLPFRGDRRGRRVRRCATCAVRGWRRG
ncbi:hypothetical protein OH687_35955 [Burkholderia anthina]|nr:hypothetical protein OH687_35955 [Burkholderia anthina]